MEQTTIEGIHRLQDLAALREGGAEVTCKPVFDIVPVDFQHREHPYRAYVFMVRFEGTVDGEPYAFRKCYARGCSHNLCPHVNMAVMIANRYLVRDLERLRKAGIPVENRLFTLGEMVVKFDQQAEVAGPPTTLEDFIEEARAGAPVSVAVALELIPAVEHFANHWNDQTFFSGDFKAEAKGRMGQFQRCFACYPTRQEAETKPRQLEIANSRLRSLYEEMEVAGVRFEPVWFR